MSVKNYHAWIRAARKASKKTGGLSLPAARKAYQITKERLGRQPKGVDVKKHPRITRESVKAAVAPPARAKRTGAAVRPVVPKKRAAPVKPAVAPRKRRVGSVEAYLNALGGGFNEFFFEDQVEYVSTAEYRKK